MKEIVGIIHHSEFDSRDVAMAQAIAEINNLARYRAKKLQYYKDWADPTKRAYIKENIAALEKDSRTKLSEVPAEDVAVRTGKSPIIIKGDNE